MGIYLLFLNASANKKIEVLRILYGWTKKEAAIKCGTSIKNYYLWEKGLSEPRNNSKRAIANAFDIDMKEIFDR